MPTNRQRDTQRLNWRNRQLCGMQANLNSLLCPIPAAEYNGMVYTPSPELRAAIDAFDKAIDDELVRIHELSAKRAAESKKLRSS